MAYQLSTIKLVEGSRNFIFHIYLENDGSEGELINKVIIDPLIDFEPIGSGNGQYKITQIWSSLVWFDALLSFDALDKQPSWVISRDAENYVDFRYFGGLKDKSSAERTGQVLLSTNGFSEPGSRGTIIIEMKK